MEKALHIAGRLNVLANVVRKPLRQIFSEFAGVGPDGDGKEYFGTGDVKYHLGTSYDRPTASGKRVHLSLLANPSHLEVRLGHSKCLQAVCCLEILGEQQSSSRNPKGSAMLAPGKTMELCIPELASSVWFQETPGRSQMSYLMKLRPERSPAGGGPSAGGQGAREAVLQR